MLFTALLLALVIFVAGLYAGFLLDSYRIGNADNSLLNKQLDVDSFVIEKDFFETFGAKDCSLLLNRVQALGGDLADIGNTLARYDAKSISHGDYYEVLKRKYFLFEIKTYTLKRQMIDICPDDESNIILFFYNVENNQYSLNQGYVLDNIVKKYKNTVVLSFDKDFNDTALRSFVSYYNVTTAPTIVVNFHKKFEGYTPEYLITQNLKE